VTSSRVVGAGAFVVIGSLMFTVALFMIGERRMLFEDRFELYTEFAKLGQLEVGAVVRVSGMDAGEVADIEIPPSPSQKFRVKMDIREDLHGIVRADSVASAQMEGLVGAIFVNIAPGTEAAPTVPTGGTIPSLEPYAFADLLAQASQTIALVSETVESMRGDIEKAVKQVSLTAEDAHGLLEDIRPDLTAMARTGTRLAADTQQIVASIREGKGTIGKLINDDALYQQARKIAEETTAVMANVRDVSAEARRAISDFRSQDGPAQGLLGDVRVTVGEAREAIGDLADNMEALKRNFLVRGFFNKRGYFDLDAISPAEYRSGVLENGRRKAMRTWLSSRVLFEMLPDGTEILSPDGKARLDSAMASYLEYVPSNPIVVEGYSTGGILTEQFQQARHRAGTVREYLLGKYALAPQATGSLALGADAQGSPDDGRWDGVAIALFLDRTELSFAPTKGTKGLGSGLLKPKP